MIIETLAVGDYQSNCYIYASEASGKGIVIDPGAEAGAILERVKKLKLEIEHIVLTHGHPDHTGALKELKEATKSQVAMHPADVPTLKNKLLYSLLGFHPADVAPDRLLDDGEILGTGEMKLEVLHTPGHTLGGICLLGEGLLFTGDTLFQMSIGRTDLPGGNTHQLMQSIKEKLMALPDETIVYPGHGPATTIGAERRQNPFLEALD